MAVESNGARASADPAEVAKFAEMARRWWDPDGPAAPLHAMQPVRLEFLRDHLAAHFGRDRQARRPLAGLRLLDVGCGPGLLCEPMARLGAQATGIDPAEESIEAARAHAAARGLGISYRVVEAATIAEEIAAGAPAFDAALCFEVVEHAPDRPALLAAISAAVAPGGLVLVSTLNRTAASFLGAIVAAERVLGWLPPGAHSWRKFTPPDVLAGEMEACGLRVVDRVGFVFAPASRRWRIDRADLSINYALAATKR